MASCMADIFFPSFLFLLFCLVMKSPISKVSSPSRVRICSPTLKAVFQLALTIPVNSCSCESSFIALRRLHAWLRNTMGQEQLSQLAVMSIEKAPLAGLDHGEVSDQFAKHKPRHHSTHSWCYTLHTKFNRKRRDEDSFWKVLYVICMLNILYVINI